jgi:hypothetical protein
MFLNNKKRKAEYVSAMDWLIDKDFSVLIDAMWPK